MLENKKIIYPDIEKQTLEMKLKGESLLIKRKNIIGYDCGFPILNKVLDGFQDELYVLAGASSMGKSTFVSQLVLQLVINNEEDNLNILFFSKDHKSIDITAKMVAQISDIPIEYVRKPFPVNDDMDKARIRGIERLIELKDRLFIIDDESSDLELMEDMIKDIKDKGENVFIVVDPLIKLLSKENRNSDFFYLLRNTMLSLKDISLKYNCGILIVFGLSKNAELRPPERKDLLEIPEILSLPHAVLTLYCDYIINGDTPFLEWDWGGRDIIVPISEVSVIKNKMNAFLGKLFFKYYASLALFKECVEAENENYRDMLTNIDFHREKKELKKRQLLEKQLLNSDKT